MKLQQKLDSLMEQGTYFSVKKAAQIIVAEFEAAVKANNAHIAKDVVNITASLSEKYKEKRIVKLLSVLVQKMNAL